MTKLKTVSSLRKTESIDPRIQQISDTLIKSSSAYRENLIRRGVFMEEDPQDISLIPRVIKREEHRLLTEICSDLTNTAFQVLDDYLRNPENIPSSPLNNFLGKLPRDKRFFMGNARYDFLKEGEEYKLVEMNFLNVGALREAAESPRLLLEMFPHLRNSFFSLSPVEKARRRLLEQEVRTVLILTRGDYSDCPSEGPDRTYLQDKLRPIKATIVPEEDFSKISLDDSTLNYDGVSFDAVYPKYLDASHGESDPIFNYHSLISDILSSDAIVFDNWLTMLLEEKDLRFLSRRNPSTSKYLPGIIDLHEMNDGNYSDWVLKARDIHCGRGVVISPTKEECNCENAILQERINTNKHPVQSLMGKTGNATYDTGVHVSYVYDMQYRRLASCDISCYLSRFSLNSDIVNMSQGGGLIPTLIER